MTEQTSTEETLDVTYQRRWLDDREVAPLLGEVGYRPRHEPPHLDLARVAEVVLGLGVTPDGDCDLCRGRDSACPKHAGEAIEAAILPLVRHATGADFRVTSRGEGQECVDFTHEPCGLVLLTTQTVSTETLSRVAREHECPDAVEMRHCDGCNEDYNVYEESHVAHDDGGRYDTAAAPAGLASIDDDVDGVEVTSA